MKQNVTKHANEDPVLTVAEALAQLNGKLSRVGFYAGIKRGEIPSIKVGNRILIPRFAYTNWLTGKAA